MPEEKTRTQRHIDRVKQERGESSRFDSVLQNQVTGFGTSADKTSYTVVHWYRKLADQELSNLYHGDDTAAKLIDLLPQEMLREPFQVDLGDPNLNTRVSDKFDSLNIREHLLGGLRWGRLYGGAGLLLGADDGLPASEPLVPERARDLEFIYTLDRRYLWPVIYYSQPGHPKLGLPSHYQVTSLGHSGSVQIVHESRLVLFGGAPTGSREKAENAGWDHSVLVRCFEALAAYTEVWQAIRILANDANQAVFKVAGLVESMSEGAKEALQARMRHANMFRSTMRALVVDAGDETNNAESFERQSVSFADVPNLLDRWMVRLASAAEIPVTLLMGRSPAGLNATGESDFRGFYDRVRSKQNNDLAPHIRRITEVYLRTKAGGQRIDATTGKLSTPVKVTFAPLWSEPPSLEATRQKTIAETDAIRIQSGVVLAEEVSLTRFPEDGTFFDGAIKIDRKTREVILEEELQKLREPTVETEESTVDPNAEPGDPNSGTKGPPKDSTVDPELEK